MSEEDRIQRAQYMRWWRWKEREGILHRPTRLNTYQEECQRLRIKWIEQECLGDNDILEIGCSGGYIIERVNGRYGMDINREVIEENRKRNPNIEWMHHDASKEFMLLDNSINIVLLPDVLEHNNFNDALFMIKEAVRVARKKVLITIPDGSNQERNQRNWACFKHKWVLTKKKLDRIISLVDRLDNVRNSNIIKDESFVYMRLDINES